MFGSSFSLRNGIDFRIYLFVMSLFRFILNFYLIGIVLNYFIRNFYILIVIFIVCILIRLFIHNR